MTTIGDLSTPVTKNLGVLSTNFTIFCETINARDEAILFWFVLFILFCFCKVEIRTALLRFIKCALSKKLIAVYTVTLVYLVATLFLLHKLNLLTPYQLKSVIVWLFTVGLTPLFAIEDFQDNLKVNTISLAKNGITTIAAVGFFVGLVPFSIYTEFFLIIPLLVICSLLLVLAEHKQETLVLNAVQTVLTIMVGTLVGRTIIEIYQNPTLYFTKETALDFLVPAFLCILYVPFTIFFATFCAYETLFVSISISIENKALLYYARLASLITFNFNTRLAKRWGKLVINSNPQTVSAINASISKMLQIWWKEKFPKPVPKTQGWMVNNTKLFLEEYGLKAGEYDLYEQVVGDSYYAASATKKADDFNSLSIFSYYIRGTAEAAKSLTLKLSSTNISRHPEKSATNEQLISDFKIISTTLWDKAIGDALPAELANSILACANQEFSSDDHTARLTYHRYDSGYDLKLIIQQKSWIAPY